MLLLIVTILISSDPGIALTHYDVVNRKTNLPSDFKYYDPRAMRRRGGTINNYYNYCVYLWQYENCQGEKITYNLFSSIRKKKLFARIQYVYRFAAVMSTFVNV